MLYNGKGEVYLISDLVQYIYSNNGTCAIGESANGYLRHNLESAGLLVIINKYNVAIIDLDLEKAEQIIINGGLAMDENKGEFMYDDILIGNDGIELDLYVLKN